MHQSLGCVVERQDTAPLRWSSAGYQARNPFGDVSLVQVNMRPPPCCTNAHGLYTMWCVLHQCIV